MVTLSLGVLSNMSAAAVVTARSRGVLTFSASSAFFFLRTTTMAAAATAPTALSIDSTYTSAPVPLLDADWTEICVVVVSALSLTPVATTAPVDVAGAESASPATSLSPLVMLKELELVPALLLVVVPLLLELDNDPRAPLSSFELGSGVDSGVGAGVGDGVGVGVGAEVGFGVGSGVWPPDPPGQKTTSRFVPRGHMWVLPSSFGNRYASGQPSDMHVSVTQRLPSVVLGMICIGTL